MSKSLLLNRIKSWGIAGGLSVLDQGIYSGSNFVFNILLARWLSPEDFGSFSLAFAIFLFFTGFYNAMILEPMSVFGMAKYADNIHRYLSSQFAIHIIVTSISAIFISSAGYVLFYFSFANSFLSYAIVGAGCFLPLMLLMWLARRAFYILGEPGWACLLSCLYSICLLGGAFYLRFMKVESSIAWFGIMGFSSLAGLIILFRLNVFNFALDKNSELSWKKLLAEQWVFGKWIILAAFLNFVATQIQIFIAAGILGLEAAGVLRALQNFMLPMMQVLFAISTLILPSIAFAYGKKNYAIMRRKSFEVSGILLFLSILYVICLFFFSDSLENFLYTNKYEEFTWLIPVIGIIPLISAFEIGFSLIVRSLQRSIYHTILTFGMAVVASLSSLYLIPSFGITGAVWSLVVTTCASLVINIWFYHKWFHDAFPLRIM
jgi:O-antigen/teichoic acid export membrane protein